MECQQAPLAPLSTSSATSIFFTSSVSTGPDKVSRSTFRPSNARKGSKPGSTSSARTNPSKTRTPSRPSLSGDHRKAAATSGATGQVRFSPTAAGGSHVQAHTTAATSSVCKAGSSTLQGGNQGVSSSAASTPSYFFASKKDASVSKRQRLDPAASMRSSSPPPSTPVSRGSSSGSGYSPSLGPRVVSREISGLTDTSLPSTPGDRPAVLVTPSSTSSGSSLPRSRSGSTASSSSGGEGKGPIERSNKRRSNSLESVEGEEEDDGRVPAGYEESIACRCTGRRKCGICRGCAGVHCKCIECWCRTCTERERQRQAKEENERKKREYELECAAEQERLLEEARLRMVTHNFQQASGVERTSSEEEVMNNADWRSSNPYRRLGLHFGASLADIKRNYYKLALMYHPDRRPGDEAAEAFVAVRQAYEELAVAHGADP